MSQEIQTELEIEAEEGRLRAEFEAAIREGKVEGPLFAGVFTVKFFIGLLISSAISVGTSLLARALTPKQKTKTGDLGGQELRIQRAGQGLFIPEILGDDPATDARIWAATTAYAATDKVLPTVRNDYYYRIQTAGTSGASQPTWPTTVGATVTNGSVTFYNAGRTGGGTKIAPIILWTYEDSRGFRVRRHETRTQGGGGSKGGPKVENVEVTWDTDLALLWARGELNYYKIFANSDTIVDITYNSPITGIIDPTVPRDDDYDQGTLPSPNAPYTRPALRHRGTLIEDVDGSFVGTVTHGNNSGLALYIGDANQLPDSVIQAAIDAKYGANSTPAYHHRAYSRHSNFYLTKWGGAVPNFNGILGNKSVKTLNDIGGYFCDRTGVLTPSNYDFTALNKLDVRGFPIGQMYTPAEVLEALGDVYNCYFFEADKIYGRVRGGAVVATIDDSELGWVDGDSDTDEQSALQELDATIETETGIARKITFKFISPDKNFEQDAQSDSRQITESEKVDGYELPLTLYAEEARAVTQRELYEEEVESTTHEGNLDWSYLWLMPGDSVEVMRDEGFTHRIFIESFNPCIGVIPFKGVAEETAVFTQPVTTDPGVFEIPPVPIPGMSLMGVYDGPLLSDEHNTVNNGSGMYVWAAKRKGDGDFGGAALYVDKGLGPELVETFDKEATFGVCATALTANTTVHDVVADPVTIDLHPKDHTLESFTRADLMAGAGPAIFGNEVGQILSATREPDTATWPNRWYVIVGLRGRRGTDFAINDHFSGERFVLINDAVKFLPLNLNDLNVERDYQMVTSGQSLDDAAVITFVWTGGSRKELSPVHATRRDDAGGNSLLEWTGRERMGHGVHNGTSGFSDTEIKRYEIDIHTNAARTAEFYKRTLPVTVGMSLAGLLESHNLTFPTTSKFDDISVEGNTISAAIAGSTPVEANARTLQRVVQTGNFIEATLDGDDNAFQAVIGFIDANADWRSATHLTIDYSAIVIYDVSSGAVLRFYAGGVQVGTDIDMTTEVSTEGGSGVRVRITLSGSEVRFYKDWTGIGTPALAVSALAPSPPLNGFARVRGGDDDSGVVIGTGRVEKVMMTTWPEAKTIYTAAQMRRDFGLADIDPVPVTVYASIYPMSPVTGRGYPAEVDLQNSF